MANPAQYYELLRRPIVTEKTSSQQGRCNQFSFEVSSTTNKVEVRKAVETLFKVKVVKVNIVNVPSKQKRTFGRPGETRPWKKAIVTLQEGQTIEIA